jgi:hypothetical protein
MSSLIITPCMWILRSNTLLISSKALWIWWCLKMMPYAFNGGLSHNHNWNLFFFSSSNIYTCCTKLSKPLDGVNGGLKWLGLCYPKCQKSMHFYFQMFDCKITQMVFDLVIDVCYGHHLCPISVPIRSCHNVP